MKKYITSILLGVVLLLSLFALKLLGNFSSQDAEVKSKTTVENEANQSEAVEPTK